MIAVSEPGVVTAPLRGVDHAVKDRMLARIKDLPTFG